MLRKLGLRAMAVTALAPRRVQLGGGGTTSTTARLLHGWEQWDQAGRAGRMLIVNEPSLERTPP